MNPSIPCAIMEVQEMRKYEKHDLAEIAMHIAAASGCGAESLDVLDALYWLDAAAQNEYNPEFFRVMLNVLAHI